MWTRTSRGFDPVQGITGHQFGAIRRGCRDRRDTQVRSCRSELIEVYAFTTLGTKHVEFSCTPRPSGRRDARYRESRHPTCLCAARRKRQTVHFTRKLLMDMINKDREVSEPIAGADRDRRWPRRLYGHGTEPDPRFSLANERTLLAWVRTALALLALGVALDAFGDILTGGYGHVLAVGILALALFCTVSGVRRWWLNEQALRRLQPLTAPLSALVLTAVLGVITGALLASGFAGWFG